MERSLIRKEIVPFLLMFGALIVATSVFDGLLHFFDLVWIGRYLGIPGTIFILLSFLYSLRKRKIITFGNPKRLLQLHIALTWTGALMILVHAGIHTYALLPWLALLAMLLNVVSGMTGMYLLGRSRRFLESKRQHYREQGLDDEAIERRLFRDSTTYDLMKKWREVHLPITLLFAVLALAHITSVFLFWQWR
jgi:hypothetical protein